MNVVRASGPLTYDGSQLRSHWAFMTFGVEGDVIVYFIGPAQLRGDQLVDLADQKSQALIRAANMLHFIAEHFNCDLPSAVLRQHLLCAIAAEVLSRISGTTIRREGDDLFVDDRKLSVSIATVSPVSALIHLGINIDPAGAPVPAIGLEELGVDSDQAGESIAHAYADEMRQVAAACTKVRWVE